MKKRLLVLTTALAITMINPLSVNAEEVSIINTNISKTVTAEGQYKNWDGVPSVAQFTDSEGHFCFAFVKANKKNKKKILIVKTQEGKITQKLKLKMNGSIFGTVAMDDDGYYYAVTGKQNSGNDTTKETIFITKYNSNGKLLQTVGNNGSSSLASYYEDRFYTKIPFEGGTCDIAMNGNYLAVHYAREMYSGHQSNSVWMIDKNTMETITPNDNSYYGYSNYESHSFGQRVIPYAGGFAFISEGDCYDRAFTFSTSDLENNTSKEVPIFDFWVKEGALDDYNMYVLNDNFAHIGNLCNLNNGTLSFVASSVPAMDEQASNQKEQIFIQIFNPTADLSSKEAYITTGTRSGTAGPNGRDSKTNYGIKWLTNIKSGSISNPQAVADENGNTIVLYEYFESNRKYTGVYYMVVDANGNITKQATLLSKTAKLNACETPIYKDGFVYWCGNSNGGAYDSTDLLIYKFNLSE